MEYIFQVFDGVCFLVKLQAFPTGCTCNRFVHVYLYRAPNRRFYKKQVQICQFYTGLGLIHMKMLVDFTCIRSKPPALKLQTTVKRA